jgi:ATP-dependent Clp protease adaptor protein ClpS
VIGGTDQQVILHNDDYTPMEFVVGILEDIFGMSREDATEIMLEVHRQGKAVCGLYAKDDAEAIVKQVQDRARQYGHPLLCTTVVQK